MAARRCTGRAARCERCTAGRHVRRSCGDAVTHAGGRRAGGAACCKRCTVGRRVRRDQRDAITRGAGRAARRERCTAGRHVRRSCGDAVTHAGGRRAGGAACWKRCTVGRRVRRDRRDAITRGAGRAARRERCTAGGRVRRGRRDAITRAASDRRAARTRRCERRPPRVRQRPCPCCRAATDLSSRGCGDGLVPCIQAVRSRGAGSPSWRPPLSVYPGRRHRQLRNSDW